MSRQEPNLGKNLDVMSGIANTMDMGKSISKESFTKNFFHISEYKERWFLSSNAKDIGTLY